MTDNLRNPTELAKKGKTLSRAQKSLAQEKASRMVGWQQAEVSRKERENAPETEVLTP